MELNIPINIGDKIYAYNVIEDYEFTYVVNYIIIEQDHKIFFAENGYFDIICSLDKINSCTTFSKDTLYFSDIITFEKFKKEAKKLKKEYDEAFHKKVTELFSSDKQKKSSTLLEYTFESGF